MAGMPRRIPDYPDAYAFLNYIGIIWFNFIIYWFTYIYPLY